VPTHAPCALKVQRKLSNGVAGFTPGGSSLDRQQSRQIPAISEMTNIRQECPGIKSELHARNNSAQTRVVSLAGIRLGSEESARAFKGIICDDISEFESHMPSQPVPSLWAMSSSQRSPIFMLGSAGFTSFRAETYRRCPSGFECLLA
jgi:hypothetical protein